MPALNESRRDEVQNYSWKCDCIVCEPLSELNIEQRELFYIHFEWNAGMKTETNKCEPSE